jgi:hypothetical protein
LFNRTIMVMRAAVVFLVCGELNGALLSAAGGLIDPAWKALLLPELPVLHVQALLAATCVSAKTTTDEPVGGALGEPIACSAGTTLARQLW